MVMALPFALGLVSAGFAAMGWRTVAVWAWAAMVVVLLSWLKFHASSILAISL